MDRSYELLSVPVGLSALVALRMLTFDRCFRLRSLPQGLSALVALRTLSLDRCEDLRSLPAKLSTLPELRVLSIKGCISLRWLRIPRSIKKMPRLTIAVTELTLKERVHSFVGWGICAMLAGFMAEAAVVLVSDYCPFGVSKVLVWGCAILLYLRALYQGLRRKTSEVEIWEVINWSAFL